MVLFRHFRKHFLEFFSACKQAGIRIQSEEKRKWVNFAAVQKASIGTMAKNVHPVHYVKDLRMRFYPAISEDQVIPAFAKDTIISFPEQYVLPDINREKLSKLKIDDINNISTDPSIKTFIVNMQDVYGIHYIERNKVESRTCTLVDNLLRIVGLDNWPLMIRNYQPTLLFLDNDEIITTPRFVISYKEQNVMVVEEDRYLKHVNYENCFGETQIATEILACGFQNTMDKITDQIIFAMRVISTKVTFYKAIIPVAYWMELEHDTDSPKKTIATIKRWPGNNGQTAGLDITESDDRRAILMALIKIRQYLLQ